MAATTNIPTMDDVVMHFSKQINSLNRAQLFRMGDELIQNDGIVELLAALEGSLAAVEAQCADWENFLDAEERSLEPLQVLVDRAEAMQERLSFAKENLPAQLPTTQASAQQSHGAAPLQPMGQSTTQLNATGNARYQGNGSKKGTRGKGTKRTVALPTLAYLRVDEFNAIPKYMRNRATREELNALIDTITDVVTRKYEILQLQRSQMNDETLAHWHRFKESECHDTDAPGVFYFTEEDLRRMASTGTGHTKRDLPCLRTAGRLKEIRTGGCVRYVLQGSA
ncbi:uncharacterized protein MONBRDRAFT_34174 [Monosiga brevicollis MX1]|uniref:Spindle and kinetochore-associated protein 1 n=1 Tax=Monosiga brevicollis TaxID=81824 RepID=A9VA06_MONBE|nr:uncharacterized protein MONBRDRAFT_34174 [Monosiga brevicollis MX1]EDQ85647.1 predicted protein [Monosiga brevicollis MX1]|eukprot:XP_001749596.1 hypothetical protein [Monosiga brevicollis MX1]